MLDLESAALGIASELITGLRRGDEGKAFFASSVVGVRLTVPPADEDTMTVLFEEHDLAGRVAAVVENRAGAPLPPCWYTIEAGGDRLIIAMSPGEAEDHVLGSVHLREPGRQERVNIARAHGPLLFGRAVEADGRDLPLRFTHSSISRHLGEIAPCPLMGGKWRVRVSDQKRDAVILRRSDGSCELLAAEASECILGSGDALFVLDDQHRVLGEMWLCIYPDLAINVGTQSLPRPAPVLGRTSAASPAATCGPYDLATLRRHELWRHLREGRFARFRGVVRRRAGHVLYPDLVTAVWMAMKECPHEDAEGRRDPWDRFVVSLNVEDLGRLAAPADGESREAAVAAPASRLRRSLAASRGDVVVSLRAASGSGHPPGQLRVRGDFRDYSQSNGSLQRVAPPPGGVTARAVKVEVLRQGRRLARLEPLDVVVLGRAGLDPPTLDEGKFVALDGVSTNVEPAHFEVEVDEAGQVHVRRRADDPSFTVNGSRARSFRFGPSELKRGLRVCLAKEVELEIQDIRRGR